MKKVVELDATSSGTFVIEFDNLFSCLLHLFVEDGGRQYVKCRVSQDLGEDAGEGFALLLSRSDESISVRLTRVVVGLA